MSDAKREFERIREAVAAADESLVAALDARARAVREMVELQNAQPDAYFTLPRDVDVLAQLVERAKDFPAGGVRAVTTEVLSTCRELSSPVSVAYVGQEGGFGHLAARKHFGTAANLRSAGTAEAVLSDVERGHASFGLLPFETSYDGAVTGTLNLLARSEMKICAEIPVPRAFHLIASSEAPGPIERIYASSSAITACEAFLREHYPDATVIDERNGIVAAEQARNGEHTAALTTEVVAQLSGLHFVRRNIEDVADLQTRYVAVGNDYPPRTGNDRTAVALALHDMPGVLVECLRPFAERNINLFRLETRPARGWEFRYLILIEVDGHITDRPMLAAIDTLRESSRYVKVLGSYPCVDAG